MNQRKRKATDVTANGDKTDADVSKGVKLKRADSKAADMKLPLPKIATRWGNLLSCGQNEVGQLGFNDDVAEKTRPALVIDGSETKVVDISAGGMHSLYLTDAGEVWSFGCNDEGALGRDTSEEGSENTTIKVDLPLPAIRITAGDSHSGFLLNDGRVLACGSFRDSHGTMGLNIKGKQQFPVEVVPGERFVDIKSGADHLVMLSNRGKVFTVGCAEQGQLGRVSIRSSSGETRRGKTQLLQPGVVVTKKFAFADAIWASTYCTFVRNRANGAIFGFGLNNYRQMAILDKGETVFTPKLTPFLDVKSITGGQHHTLVLTNDNKCYAVGRKDYGRLGIGENIEEELIDKLVPIRRLADASVQQLDCGECCSFAITDDGKVYSWGMGSNQQLGVGADDDIFEPTQLTGLQVRDKEVLKVSSGGQHTLFIAYAEPSAANSGPAKSSNENKKKTTTQK